jgi:N6-adenosine-specific RNA methylase IME4
MREKKRDARPSKDEKMMDMNDIEGRDSLDARQELLTSCDGRRFGAILADPPWRSQSGTGKVAPEHWRLSRYRTMSLEEIAALPVESVAADTVHLYLWAPNALLPAGLEVLNACGFAYETNIVWHEAPRDERSDGRGVGFYFRNVTELALCGVRGKGPRTLGPGRRQANGFASRWRGHSRKPVELCRIIESCSPGPDLELFARGTRGGWTTWGDEAECRRPTWPTHRSRPQEGRDESAMGC